MQVDKYPKNTTTDLQYLVMCVVMSNIFGGVGFMPRFLAVPLSCTMLDILAVTMSYLKLLFL